MSSTINYNNSTITTLNDGQIATLSTAAKYVPYNLVITDTTDVTDALNAIAAKGVTVPAGSDRSDLATLIGQIQQGGGSAITITDTLDAAGGTIRSISAVSLDGDTIQASKLAAGYTAHDRFGSPITGTAILHDTSNDYDWMGINPTFVGNVYKHKTLLKDSAFNSWTPSTTAKTNMIASSNGTVTALDLENYEYWLVWRWYADIQLNSGATKKAQVERQFGTLYTYVNYRPYGLANFETMTDTHGYVTNIFTGSSYTIYWNTSGTKTWTSNLTYGFYPANTASELSSATTLTPNLTPKSPSITVRCSSSYFATARAAEVDKDNSSITIRGDLYRVAHGSGSGGMFYRDALKMYNTPLTDT